MGKLPKFSVKVRVLRARPSDPYLPGWATTRNTSRNFAKENKNKTSAPGLSDIAWKSNLCCFQCCVLLPLI